MNENSPFAPLTELAAGAVQMHELFRAWVDAGFTEQQAMQLLCAMLTANRPG